MTSICEIHDHMETAMQVAKSLFQDNHDLADVMGDEASPVVYKLVIEIVFSLQEILVDVPTNVQSMEQWEILCKERRPDQYDWLVASPPAFTWNDRAAAYEIEDWNRTMIGIGRKSVFVMVSTLDRYDDCSLSIYWEKRGFSSWHEAAFEIAKQICREYFTYYGRLFEPESCGHEDLQAWIHHWAETDWAEILQGMREEWQADDVLNDEGDGEGDAMIGPKSPQDWEKLFKISWRTIRRRIDSGEIRARKLNTKSWHIHRDDVPHV